MQAYSSYNDKKKKRINTYLLGVIALLFSALCCSTCLCSLLSFPCSFFFVVSLFAFFRDVFRAFSSSGITSSKTKL